MCEMKLLLHSQTPTVVSFLNEWAQQIISACMKSFVQNEKHCSHVFDQRYDLAMVYFTINPSV